MTSKVDLYLSERKGAAAGKNAEYWREFEELYQKKLWHRLTVQLKDALSDPEFVSKENLTLLYDRFIRDFEQRINQLALIQIGLLIARSYKDQTEGAKFLETLSQSITKATPSSATNEALVLCTAGAVDLKLEVRDPRTNRCQFINEVKTALEDANKRLDAIVGVSPTVHGEFYRVSSKYLREIGDFSAYYRESLRYLGCIDVEKDMPLAERRMQAKCLALAALLSEDIYNIGELLAHPVLKSLGGDDAWLLDILNTFNSGDLNRFEQLRGVWSKQDDLQKQSAMLENKVRLLSLMELAFARPSKDRQLTFKEIATTAKIDINAVELLVMKAFALGLVKGYIDEVDQKVLITWVQPRVLDRRQIGVMAQRFSQWGEDVKGIERLIEVQAEDILTH